MILVPTAPNEQPKSSFPPSHHKLISLYNVHTLLFPNLITILSSEIVQLTSALSAYWLTTSPGKGFCLMKSSLRCLPCKDWGWILEGASGIFGGEDCSFLPTLFHIKWHASCHFTDEESEVQKRDMTYSRAYSELRAESAPDPKFLDVTCRCSVLRVVCNYQQTTVQ